MTYTATYESTCTSDANGSDGKTVVSCCDSDNCNTAAPTNPIVTSCFTATSGSSSWPSSVTSCTGTNYYCKSITSRSNTAVTYTATCEATCTESSNNKTNTKCCDSKNCNNAAPSTSYVTSCYLDTNTTVYPSAQSTCPVVSGVNYNYCKYITSRVGTTPSYISTCEVDCSTSTNAAGTSATTCCDSNNCNNNAAATPTLTSCYLVTSSSSYPTTPSACSGSN